jgi:hypothetical protein
MSPVVIPWPTTALPGRRPGEGQGDLVNAYAVQIGQLIEVRRTPGLSFGLQITPSIDRVPRGMLATPFRLLHVWDGKVWSAGLDGADVPIAGSLPGTDRVTMAQNMRYPIPQVVIVDDLGAYEVDLNTNTVIPYSDTTLGAVESVEYYAGYFIFTRTNGDIVASDLQSTVIPDLSWAKAEYASDAVLRTKSTGAALLVMGTRSVEIWVDVGSSPFPLQRSSAIDVGLFGKFAVAGGASEWEGGVLFVGSDYTVRQMQGQVAKIVSNDDVAHDIFQWRATPDLVFAQVYNFEQQSVFSIMTTDWTWEFNIATGQWHRRDSYGIPYWRATAATNFAGRWYAQDWLEGKLFEVTPGVYAEDNQRMRFRVDSGPIKIFPGSIRIPSIDIDMSVALGKTGVPSPFETNPSCMISWSHDGGAHWARPLARSFGRVGRFAQKVTVNNLGRSTSQGCRIRLEVTDPVPVVIIGGLSVRTKPGGRVRSMGTP